ncbi:MAG TPA: LamG-like jellyroll fold domain-containing protein [Candidatus Acidoferrum sp.]|nr:LamG-like jellyroll fold domain-containing protein [Candidatus Acidoferrum sp.]
MNSLLTTQRPVLQAACLVAWLLVWPLRSPGQTLYYGTSSTIAASNTVQSVVTNGMANALLFTASGSFGHCTAVAVDPLNSKLFLADGESNEIWSLNLSGGALTSINNTLAFASGLALDTVNQKIYYTTTSAALGNNKVQRMDYSGLNNTLLLTAGGIDGNGVQRGTALALDPVNSLIFVADAGASAIWSMNLSGGNLTKVAGGLVGAPLDLAVDPANQLVYFVTSSATQTADTIQRAGYNGANGSVLLTATGSSGNGVQRCTSLDLDLANARIYFSDAGSNAIWSLPLAGGSPTLVKGGLTAATVKKVRLFIPSNSGITGHLSYSNLVAATPNLLGYWPFSPATQANSFDNGYTGTFQGSAAIGGANSGPPLLNMPGNTALILNGAGSWDNTSLVGGLSASGPNADQGSIIGWFNLSVLPSSAGRFFTIAAESYYGNDFDVQIETDNKIKFYTDSGSATVDNTALTAADLNSWIFFAATFNSNVSRFIYLNGVQVAGSVPGTHNPAQGGGFSIGASTVFAGRYFQGALDEIAIFNRELTPGEISTLYAAGLGIAFIPLDIGRSGANVVVSWTDPTSQFSLQAAPAAGGTYTNVPGATSPYTHPTAGAPMFFQLIAH